MTEDQRGSEGGSEWGEICREKGREGGWGKDLFREELDLVQDKWKWNLPVFSENNEKIIREGS